MSTINKGEKLNSETGNGEAGRVIPSTIRDSYLDNR